MVAFRLALLNRFAEHHNGVNPFLGDHLPKVIHGVLHWSLCADESSLAIDVRDPVCMDVTLGIELHPVVLHAGHITVAVECRIAVGNKRKFID